MIGKTDDAFNFHLNALNLRGHRHQILASNVVNADTPNYKARDFDFQKALQNTVSANSVNTGLTVTSSRHIQPAGVGGINGAKMMYRIPNQPSIDGNTVDMDSERARFLDNSIHYEANITFINSHLKNIMAALQGA
jgi:flagellar basal-body rod protein FlgB